MVAIENGGAVSPEVPLTDSTGAASFKWRLGSRSGPQTVRARSGDAPPVSLTATATPGPPATVTKFVDNQRYDPGAAVPIPPAVTFTDVYGNVVPGLLVSWEMVEGGTQLNAPARRTDDAGRAAVLGWVLGQAPGVNRLRATIEGMGPFDFSAVAVDRWFNVDIVWAGAAPSAAVQAAAENAASRWMRTPIPELPDVPIALPAGVCGGFSPALNGFVDDVLVVVQVAPIDGPGGIAGRAGQCVVRQGTSWTVVGGIQLDADDAVALDGASLYTVLSHEIGHVMGIGGPAWQARLAGAGGADPTFTGISARGAYWLVGGPQPNAVPVQESGGAGTRDVHWRESVMRRELMTAYFTPGVPNPLSFITLGALVDMGYPFANAGGEQYRLSDPALREGPGPLDLPFADEILAPSLVLSPDGRLMPWPGPR